jgi:hypothetical protein
MFKGLSILAATEVGGVIHRNLRAASWFVAAGLVLIFGAGYLIDVAHTLLSQRFSPLAASGIVAASLMFVAAMLIVIGLVVKSRRKPVSTALTTTALVAAPVAARLFKGQLKLGTVLVAGVIGAGALLGRQMGR